MTILETQIKLHYSGSTSKNGPGGPQGGVISTFAIPEQTIAGGILIDNTMFVDVTNTEARNGSKRYFCFYIKNIHPSQTATNIKIWQSALTPGGDNIRVGYSGAPINTHDAAQSAAATSIYNLGLSGQSVSRMDHDRFRAGIYVSSTNSRVYNQAITKAEFFLKRVGTPTGTLSVLHKNRKSETVLTDFGSIDVTTINNSTPTLYAFEAPSNTLKMKVEDIIACHYTTGTETSYIAASRRAGSPIRYSHVINHDGTQWRDVPDFDLCGALYTGGISGDDKAPPGVNFENPVNKETAISLPALPPNAFVPVWLRREVPINVGSRSNNTSELAIAYRTPDP